MNKTLTIAEWCRFLDMDYATYKQRIRKGMTPYEAISTPVKKYDELVTHKGVTLKASEWCKKVGISNNAYHSRMSHLGWSKEKACTTPYLRRY